MRGGGRRVGGGARFGGGGEEWEGVCWEEGSFDRVLCDVPCSGQARLRLPVLCPRLCIRQRSVFGRG